MQRFYLLLCVVAWSLWSISFAAAQEAAPAADPAAPAAPAAPPVVPLKSEDPSVQALLATKPTTPKELFEVTNLLLDLDQPELARAMLVKLIEASSDPTALVELGRKYGKREVLRLGETPALQPEGKPFADKIIAAMNASDRDPARIANLIQQLQDPSYNVRVAAINNLRAGGDGAITALLDGLADANRAAEHAMLRTALAGLGEAAVGPLRAMIASGDEATMTTAVKTMSLIEGPAVVNDLYAAALGKDYPATTHESAQAALAKRLSKLPQPPEAAVKLFLDADRLYRRDSSLDPGPVAMWKWNAEQKKPIATLGPQLIDDNARAARYAKVAAEVTNEAPAQVLSLAAALESALAEATDPQQFSTVAQTWAAERKPSRRDLEAVYELTTSLDRTLAAALCIEVLGSSGDAEQLLTGVGGRPTLLVRAAASPDPTIRFAAVEAILKLKPTQPFSGSSGVADSLAWFASSDGAERAVVVDSKTSRGRDTAGMLIELKLQADAVADVREALALIAAEADVQVVLVDRRLLEPSQGNFLARLRSDYRSARKPVVVVCEPEDVDRTRTRFYADPFTFAIIRPTGSESLLSQLRAIPNLGNKGYVIPPERQRRAETALTAMQQLLATKNTVFNLQPFEPELLTAANSPTRGMAAVGVLGQYGSPAAQRMLAEVASATARPLELRQAAAAAFVESVKRFGTLLTTTELTRQYERYNAAETLDKPTQELLASMLNVIEARVAPLPSRAERKTSAAAAPAP